MGKDNTHLKLSLRDLKSGIVMSGIGFGIGDKADLVRSGKPLSVVYTLEENHWRNKVSLQMRIKDVKAIY